MSETATIHEGPGKGQAYFNTARTVAESGNYDYAIEMYIMGLAREPENMAQHQALYDVSLRRKVKGGKAAGGLFGPKMPLKGKTPKDQMLNAEWLLAKDPGNISQMQTIVRQALAGNFPDVIRFYAPLLMLANRAKPRKDIYLEIADIYEKIAEFNKASEAVQGALELTPSDGSLITLAKNLAARETIKKGQFDTVQDFKDSLKSREDTKNLLEQENLTQSEDYRLKSVRQAKADYEQNTKDHQLISKYQKALRDMDSEEYETIALEVLKKAFEETKTYRYKAYMGDVRMKQYKRNLHMLQEAAKADPKDKMLQLQIQDVAKERLAYELEEFHERVVHYPTEMMFQYEYGLRLFRTKRFDEAIGALQIAQNNPKVRADALYYLGQAFFEKGLMSEAIDTLKRSKDSYELAETGDAKSKNIYYSLGRALQTAGNIDEAVAIYSKIMQWDYGFLDVRTRLEALRKKPE